MNTVPTSQKKVKAARRKKNQKQKKQKKNMSEAPRSAGVNLKTAQKMANDAYNLNRLNIPRNEQDKLNKSIIAGRTSPMRAYLSCIVNPKYNMVGVPDSFNRPTALIRSTTVFNVPIQLFVSAAATDSGRFSLAIQPHMGGLRDPSSYKIAMVVGQSGVPWTSMDFANANTYVKSVMNFDPRLDKNYLVLTQGPPGNYELENRTAPGMVTPFPFVTTGAQPYENQNGSWIHYNTPGVQLLNTGVAGNRFKLAVGQYSVRWLGVTANTFSSGPNINLVAGDPTMFFKDAVTSDRSVDLTMSTYAALFTVKAAVTVELVVPLTSGVATYTVAEIAFNPVFYTAATQTGVAPQNISANSYPLGENGIMQQYRTVAMSALATYTGPVLTNGGNIAANYLPGAALEADYFTNAPNAATGSLQSWEVVSNTREAYSGPLDKGCYVIWRAEDTDELQFRTPDYANTVSGANASSLVISGQYTPGAITADQVAPVLRIEINTVYEIVTLSQLLQCNIGVGTTSILDAANLALVGQPMAMQNATHMSWISDFLGGVKEGLGYVAAPAKLLYDNRDKILPFI